MCVYVTSYQISRHRAGLMLFYHVALYRCYIYKSDTPYKRRELLR